ncbi:MAG: hypothetical protein EOO69_11245 [Moraxellaceae bacterium]|nr:MAG: hypothetical protein EOO69_11245 [Moraxellaceae bacterium]
MKIYLSVLSIMLLGTAVSGCASKTERQFVSGCESTGVDEDICECVFDKLEDKYGEDDLKHSLYTMNQTERFQHDMLNSTMQCMQE